MQIWVFNFLIFLFWDFFQRSESFSEVDKKNSGVAQIDVVGFCVDLNFLCNGWTNFDLIVDDKER